MIEDRSVINLNAAKPELQKRETSITLADVPKILSIEVRIYNAWKCETKLQDADVNMEADAYTIFNMWAAYLGCNIEEGQLSITFTAVKINFPALTLTDLAEAIMLFVGRKLKARDKDYDFPSITPLYVLKVLSFYVDYRKDVLHSAREKILRLESKVEYVPTAEEIILSRKQHLIHAFEAVLVEKGVFDDPGSVIFNFVKKNEFVQFTPELISAAQHYGHIRAKQDADEKEKRRRQAGAQNVSTSDLHESDPAATAKKYSRVYVVNQWLKSIYTDVKVSKKDVENWIAQKVEKYPTLDVSKIAPDEIKSKALLSKQIAKINEFLGTITLEMIEKE